MEENIIYEATIDDTQAVADMAMIMWENHTLEDLKREFEAIINNEESVVFLKVLKGHPVGFAQCQLRHDYVEGTASSPVGYLEGIFIKQEYRRAGYAKELLKECEKWAIKKGCKEFASDCELENSTSLEFHLNLGFAEVNRIICFKKNLRG